MITIYVLAAGYILDLLFGDPPWLPHPVRGMGAMISKGEKILRRISCKTAESQFFCGMLLSLIVISVSFLIPFILLKFAYHIHLFLGAALEAVMCYQILALKSLKTESMLVYKELHKEDLPVARQKLSRIVSRDTAHMDESQIAKSTVETIAENTSDGVIAPVIFILVGGAPLGFLYKAVNTLDSMIGYKNEKYSYFGKFAARLDDLVNFVPARISALLMLIVTFLPGSSYDTANAWRIYKRDRQNHPSPNSAHTEAVCAGALHIQLAGDNYYFGRLVRKPTIGDSDRTVDVEDIKKANELLYKTAFLALILGTAIRLGIMGLF